MIIGTALMGLNLAQNIFGISGENRKRKKALEEIAQNRKNLEQWYNKTMNSDVLDTTEVKNIVNELNETKKQQDSALANNLNRTGATPEAEVAKSAAINKQYSDSVAKLAALGTKQKSDATKFYLNKISDLNGKKTTLNEAAPTAGDYISAILMQGIKSSKK